MFWAGARLTNVRSEIMAKVIAVLYPDPVEGFPKKYARDSIPKIDKYPDGQTAPTPSAIDFKPGQLLGQRFG
jgi:formate dehydrogenase